MTRAKSTTTASSTPDLNALIASLTSGGTNLEEVMAKAKADEKKAKTEALRAKALSPEGHGIVSLVIKGGTKIKLSTKIGLHCFSDLVDAKNVFIGKHSVEDRLSKLRDITVQIIFDKACKQVVDTLRSGHTEFEFVLKGPMTYGRMQARFESTHPHAEEPIFLIDPSEDNNNEINWTHEVTAHPYMKPILNVSVTSVLSNKQASTLGLAVPEDEDEFDAMLDTDATISKTLNQRSLNAWMVNRPPANNDVPMDDDAIASTLNADAAIPVI